MKNNFENLQFYNFPKKMGRRDYEDVVALAVSDLKKNPDVVSLYLMGDKWVPGISDMDIIAVYKNGVRKKHKNHPKNLSETADYIFTHDYISYDEESFKRMKYIYPSKYTLQILYGKDIFLQNPEDFLSESEVNNLKASFVVDCLTNKLLSFPLYFNDKIDIREKALLWMHSFIYTKKITEEVIGKNINSEFPETVLNLRERCFVTQKKEFETLSEKAIKEGFNLVVNLTKEMDVFLKNKLGIKKYSKNPIFESISLKLKGIEDWDEGVFLNGIKIKKIEKPIFIKQVEMFIPESFFGIFDIYASGSGVYSKWFKSMLNYKIKSFEKHRGIMERVDYLNKLPILADGRVLTNTTLQYGFNTKSIMKDKIKSLLIKIL